MASSRTFYDILKVGRHAQKGEIKEAYRKLALRRHPDKDLYNPHATAEFQELCEAYRTLHDENGRIVYDKKLREEHSSSQRDTGYGENQQPNKAPRRNSRGRYPPTSESEDDDSWKERMRTAGRAHERPEKMKRAKDTRNREESKAKHGKNEWSQRNWDDYPRPSEETGVKEDHEPARETRQQEEKTKGHREAGDRECSQAKGKEEREWLTELQPRLEALLQLRNMIETMEADVKDMELEDAEILQDERRLRSRTACHTSIWDQIRENEEIEQAMKHAERFQARTSARLKLGRAENELKPLEDDYKTFLSLQSRQRKEQADRLEATLRAATDYYAQQEAYEKWARKKETPEKVAREKGERRREAEANQREVRREHDERESARNEARRAEHRETQKDEAIRRQHVLEKINKQKQGTMRQESRSSKLNGPKRNESGPEPGHVRTSESDFASSPERTRSRRSPRSRNYQPRFRTGSPTPYQPSTSSWRDPEEFYTSDSE